MPIFILSSKYLVVASLWCSVRPTHCLALASLSTGGEALARALRHVSPMNPSTTLVNSLIILDLVCHRRVYRNVSSRVDCQRKRIPPTKVNIFAQYVTRVRSCIHLVICMSPIGSAFRDRLRMFPSLVNCCTIGEKHPPNSSYDSAWRSRLCRTASSVVVTILGHLLLHYSK